MNRSQFDGIIAHMERDLEGDGYKVEITVNAPGRVLFGALLPKIPARLDVVGLRLTHGFGSESPTDDIRNIYIDIAAIIGVRGPIL